MYICIYIYICISVLVYYIILHYIIAWEDWGLCWTKRGEAGSPHLSSTGFGSGEWAHSRGSIIWKQLSRNPMLTSPNQCQQNCQTHNISRVWVGLDRLIVLEGCQTRCGSLVEALSQIEIVNCKRCAFLFNGNMLFRLSLCALCLLLVLNCKMVRAQPYEMWVCENIRH